MRKLEIFWELPKCDTETESEQMLLENAATDLLTAGSPVQLSCSVVSDSAPPWTAARQASLSIANSRVYPNSCPLSQWRHPTIPSSVVSFSSCPQSFRASGLFQWVSSLHQVAKVLEFQLQHQSFQWIFRTDFLYDGLVGSPCCPRDSQWP